MRECSEQHVCNRCQPAMSLCNHSTCDLAGLSQDIRSLRDELLHEIMILRREHNDTGAVVAKRGDDWLGDERENNRRRLQQDSNQTTAPSEVHVKDLMRGKHIRVVLKLDPAMVVNTTGENDGVLSYSGFAIELLDKIALEAGFTYEFVRASKEGLGGGWNDACE